MVVPTIAKAGFFGDVSYMKRREKTMHLVDLGGNGDCGFRAIAAGIVDKLLQWPVKQEAPAYLETLLQAHARYFPEQCNSIKRLPPLAQIQWLIKNTPMPVYIQSLAYTLRQLAVNELFAHPAHYRGAFVNQHEKTAPEKMRQAQTWIDESAIAALSNALQLPLEVRVTGPRQPLYMRLQYNTPSISNGSILKEPVVIELNQGHYRAYVSDENVFSLAARHPMPPKASPLVSPKESDPPLAELLAQIAAEDERMTRHFNHLHQQLTHMNRDDQLPKSLLVSIYCQSMKNSDYLQGRVAAVGYEYGHDYFHQAILASQKMKLTPASLEATHEHALVSELIHAIARAVAIGQLQEHDVFNAIDDYQEKRCLPVR